MASNNSLKNVNWERKGHETMRETRDINRAKDVCGFLLRAYEDELRPLMNTYKTKIAELQTRIAALCRQWYDSHDAPSDMSMFSMRFKAMLALISFVVAALASATGHAATLMQLGWSLAYAIVVGVVLTALLTVVGMLLHTKVLHRFPVLETVLVVAIFAVMIWALIDLAQVRGSMAGRMAATESSESYVEDTPAQALSDTSTNDAGDHVSESSIRSLLSSASIKLAIAADGVVGILLGMFISIRTDEHYSGWREIRSDKRKLARTSHEHDRLLARIESAKKLCAAGITRAAHFNRKPAMPYLIPVVLLAMYVAVADNAYSQEVKRQELILLDVSGSVASKSQTHDFFNEMLQGVKQLLRTEPPESRTWTVLVTTDSFAGMPVLVRGWTPAAAGIFTDRLEAARRQLVAAFEAKAGALKASADGTDIFGALARSTTLFSTSMSARDIYIFSDMINETPAFNMPALLPIGAKNMLRQARKNALIVPLNARVYIYGASTANLNPASWTTIRDFWTEYIKEAGGELVIYSSEPGVRR